MRKTLSTSSAQRSYVTQ